MKSRLFILIAAVAFLCMIQTKHAEAQSAKKGMIKVTILYPNGEGKKFDMNYYTTKHFPMLRRLFGNTLKGTAIDKGLAAGATDAPIPYLAVGYLYFENVEAFRDGMKIHAKEIRGDIPHYTNITPIIQISEVVE
ncbi:ethyl tert-butyl ether degradation protein EthD [Mucilaginibacter sp. MD40]|uniref:EthD family reductase n=1 Tax=Mucilaginibacter sp. MD40 TaxID=2029590 RepID=UPI000BACC5DB|nr:EthD family reductase [Mucilaginibacter sp. MD40]PAW93424.1 ethyl tert-butyl ether degradation protein EthD [Mucilaginibacter sp. MD40]